MSEIEKVRAQLNAVYEGLSLILSRWNEIEEGWLRSGQVVANQETLEKAVKEALFRAQPMKTRNGSWLWSRDAPVLKEALLKVEKRRLEVTVDGKAYSITLGDAEEEPNAFISFWPRSK